MALNLKLEVESKLGLEPEKAYHNLAIAKLQSVEVIENEYATQDEQGNPSLSEYAGLTVPRIKFHFVKHQIEKSNDKNPREYVASFGAVNTTDKDKNPLTEKEIEERVSEQFSLLIHMHNVYRKHAGTEPLNLDILNKFNPIAPVEDRVKQLKEVYEYLVSKFNEINKITNKAIYADVVIALMLIPGGKNRTQFVLPKYVGNGFIEIFKNLETKPAIKVPVNVSLELGKTVVKSVANVKNTAQNMFENLGIED